MTPEEQLIKDSGVDGWTAWKNHVLLELQRLSSHVEKIDESVGEIKTDIGQLKIKSAIFGGVGASVVGLIIWLISMVIERGV